MSDYPNFKKSKKTPGQVDKAARTKKAVLAGYTPPKKRGPKRTVGC